MEQKFSKNLAKYRKRSNMTQGQLAATLHVTPQAVSKWENGSLPDPEFLPAIARTLGTSLDVLFGLQEERAVPDLEQLIADTIRQTPAESRAELVTHLFYAMMTAYNVYGDSSDIRLLKVVENVTDNQVNITLPAYSAAMVVITDDAADLGDIEVYDPDRYTQETETFDDPQSLINGNGYVEVPITDAAALKEIRITANVTSSAGSSWGNAGCAVGINAVDSEGTEFWTSKGYSLDLGNGSTAVVEFDGTLMNKDVPVEAVISDGKVELQTWWTSSEKAENNIEDTISVNYTKIEVVYEYDTKNPDPDPEVKVHKGDVDCDGNVRITDVILLNRFIAEDNTVQISEQGILNAEVDGADGLTNADAIEILKFLAGLDSTL